MLKRFRNFSPDFIAAYPDSLCIEVKEEFDGTSANVLNS
jgi:hypothetical protein